MIQGNRTKCMQHLVSKTRWVEFLIITCNWLNSSFQLLPACDYWDDCLWAYFKVMVDQQTEQEIREKLQSRRDLEPLPPVYQEKQ